MIVKVYNSSWKNLSEVQTLLVMQYLESSCSNFEIDHLANYREPVQTGGCSLVMRTNISLQELLWNSWMKS